MTPLANRRLDVVSLGEALVDFLPSSRGPLETVPTFERHPGGAPANVAIGVARLGGASALVGAVGEDPFGTYVLEALAREGVDVSWMVRQPRGKTGLAFVSLDAAGKPKFYSPGGTAAELALDPDAVARVRFDDTRLLHFSTALLRAETARAATFAALDGARAAGCVVAFDPNLRLHHLTDTRPLREDLARILPLVDVVKLSSDEIGFVCGTSDPLTAARMLVAQGPRLAVVTLGAEGCLWARPGADGRVGARGIDAVDTTGAGDGFQAGLTVSIARLLGAGRDPFAAADEELARLLSFACEVGTRVCEQVGAVAGLPRLAAPG